MDNDYVVTAPSPLRRAIAARMTEASGTIPHFRLRADIELDALQALREELRSENAGAHLSLNDLLIKVCATSLMQVPAVNIQWLDDQIRQYRDADVSIITSVEGGLSTPIVRGANLKSVWEIAREARDLAARAATNRLKMDEVVGGTFGLSNLGMYGVDQFDAIINPPQCLMLAAGVAKPRVVVSQDRTSRIATVMKATLSVDHRAIDGVLAAQFLSVLKQLIEEPAHLRSRSP